MATTNPMRAIKIEKVTLNVGGGSDQDKIEKGIKLITMITGKKPIKTITQERIPGWAIRPGLPVGCKITLRKAEAVDVLKRILTARDNKLEMRNFDDKGNLNFGMVEYIYIPGVKYDPAIGVMGFQVTATLERPGFRIKRRKLLKKMVPKDHRISKAEAIDYIKNQFKVEVAEE
jgi:large subunit ribosomal protein L5